MPQNNKNPSVRITTAPHGIINRQCVSLSMKDSSNNTNNNNHHQSLKTHNNNTPSETIPTQEQPNICRICYEPQVEGNLLLSPCQCEGSMKYIHSLCLREWIIKQPHNSNTLECEICKEPYLLQLRNKLTFSHEKFKKYRTKTIILIAILSVILILAGIAIYFCIDRISINEDVKKKYIIAMSVLLLFIYGVLVYSVFYSVRQKCYNIESDIVDIKNYEKKEEYNEGNMRHNQPMTVLVINNYLLNPS